MSRFGQSFIPAKQAFTLIELLVVTAVIGILAGLLLPAVNHATAIGKGATCVSNLRQITLGWLMYADDHQGALCPNGTAPKQGWVEGVLDFNGSTDNTNRNYIASAEYAKLSPYIDSAAVYRCPSDKSMVHIGRQTFPRVRSIAMNEAVGTYAEAPSLSPDTRWRIYRKQQDITGPEPSSLWVLTEQHPDSIDDGRFAVDCGHQGDSARLIDFPANFHNHASALAFADGHAELHRWVVDETLQPNKYCGCLAHYAVRGVFTSSPNSPDVAWLQARTSAKKN